MKVQLGSETTSFEPTKTSGYKENSRRSRWRLETHCPPQGPGRFRAETQPCQAAEPPAQRMVLSTYYVPHTVLRTADAANEITEGTVCGCHAASSLLKKKPRGDM